MQQSNIDSSKFFVDAMLGNVAKKLRILGYDTKYSSNIDDMSLIDIAKDEQRIILTKDSDLVNIALKTNVKAILISEKEDIKQMIQIREKCNLSMFVINMENTRCTKCNRVLSEIARDEIENLLPKMVINNNKRFWICELCKKLYWEGSHIENLKKFVVSVNEGL